MFFRRLLYSPWNPVSPFPFSSRPRSKHGLSLNTFQRGLFVLSDEPWYEFLHIAPPIVFCKSLWCIIHVNLRWSSEFWFLFVLKVFTAHTASTGQAFWYVRTWWRRWTGGKGCPPPIKHNIQYWTPPPHTHTASQRCWPVNSDGVRYSTTEMFE